MKEIKFLSIVILVCCVFGCSDQFMDEDLSIREKKINFMKRQIVELAEEYGLNIKLNSQYIEDNFDKIDIDSIENEMRNLSSLKGIYSVSVEQTKKGLKMAQRRRKRISPTLALTSHSESYTFPTHNSGLYSCNCIAVWMFNEKENSVTWSEVSASVSKATSINSVTQIIPSRGDHQLNSISFSGNLIYGSVAYGVTFYVSGSCNCSSGQIKWE